MSMIIDKQHEKLHQLNRHIGLILRIMSTACLLLMLAGMIMYLVTGTSPSLETTPLPALLNSLPAFSPAKIIVTGLSITLLMPPAILMISLIHFIVEKDIKLIIICTVLGIMLAASCLQFLVL